MTVTSMDVHDKVESTGNDLLGRWARVVATFDDFKIAIYTNLRSTSWSTMWSSDSQEAVTT